MNDMNNFFNTKDGYEHLTNKELKEKYYLFKLMNNNFLSNTGTFLLNLSFKMHLPINSIVKKTIFKLFCGGETIEECFSVIDNQKKHNVKAILDYAIEGENNEDKFNEAEQIIIETIKNSVTKKESIPFCVFKMTGIGDKNIFIKVQNKDKLDEEEIRKFENIKKRVHNIAKTSFENNVKLFIDAEESFIQNVIDEIVYNLFEEFNQKQTIIFNTVQMYRYDRLDYLQNIYNFSKGKFNLGFKLVRGAYLKAESEYSQLNKTKYALYNTKEETDNAYNKAVEFCLDNKIDVCIATHNELSCFNAINKIKELNLNTNDEKVYFAQLFGMGDFITYPLAKNNYNVAKYIPYGKINLVIPYLTRRAQENTSAKNQQSREFSMIKTELERREK